MKKYNKLFAILFAVLGVQTLSAQIEYISNGDNLNLQYNFGSPSNHAIPEIWTSDARQGYNFSQSVELPNGVYKLEFQMMYRASKEVGTSTNCVLYAETSGSVYNASIKNFGDETGTTESLDGVTSAMNNGLYMNTLPYFIVTNGKAIVGARSLGALTYCTNGYWLIYNPSSFKLTNVVDDATLTQALSDVKAEAQTILDAAADSEAKNTLQNAYDAATATADGIVSLKKAIRAYLPNTGTATNPVDVSSLILSADFSQKAFIVATKNNNSGVSLPELQPVGWTCTDTGNGQYNFFNVVANNTTYDGQSNFAYNGKTTGQSLYMRHAWGNANLVAKQTVKFPNGRYKISIPAKKTGNTATVKYTFAGITETHNVTTSWAVYEKTFTVNDINNELTIELTYSHPSGGGNRAYFDGVTLLCYGDPIKALLEEISTKASELRGYETKVPQTAYNGYSECLTAAENANNSMEETALQTILDNLNVAINDAVSLVTSYANVQALININESILSNSEEFETGAKETFQIALNTAKTDVETATTADAINDIYNTLETARQTYVVKADPTNDTYFDYTFLMTNPAVSNGDGWIGARTNVDQQYIGAPDNTYWDSWNGAGQNIYQELAGLPSGLYTLKAAGRASESCTSAYIYLNDTKVEIDKAGSTGNDLGNGWKWYTTEKTAVAGTAKVGFGCNTASSQWAGADDFHLYYYGFDVATAQTGITTLKAEAEDLVGKPMNAEVATALDEAITGADATKTTRNELNSMIDALNTAIASAKTSIAEYDKIATYIDKANTIDGSIAADVQTQYDNGALEKAEPVFQALEVATYNYVTENFNYAVAISSTWNSTGTNTTAKEFSNEHWSGANRGYMNQNDDNGQGWNANSWSLDFDQDVKLPAGEYVFKVAGRKSSAATLKLVVTKGETTLGTVEDFPNGNATRGINKAGAASFDPEDSEGFANNGNGFGWQWRYVKFTLDSEATVKIAVHAETNELHNWVSFGDYTLQMTEETYLEANKGGLDAPTAAAEALVDTKPMGRAENQALKDALALPVTTGAELLAKIDALNAAVADANTWIADYNTAKAPLVAALERFETDYNDAENGAIDHMNKERWTTAVNMAQAAAVAKDVTDSYEGFATATENLVAALDAATVSVGEYADLKKAIDEATPYLGGDDWGSEPFQKPESAKDDFNAIKTTAQNAYDAAEVDGESVTAVIESLKTAINDVVLNAPEEGQRFYIKVATEGHAKEGNAILATLGATSNNNPTGYGLNTNNVAKGYLAQAFIFTQVEENLYNISIERPEGTVYLTYGSLNGSAAGWNKQQIQATTDAEKKGDFKIVPTGKNGILKIFNTVDNNYLDCQDGGSIYTDTDISNEEFAFELATEHEVTLNISSAGWATLILPFNAEIPEGMTVYASKQLNEESVALDEVKSIVANTPYLISGTEGTYNFSGYGLADGDEYKDANGLFVGTYVDYITVGGEYVLQKHDDVVAFYLVGDAKPKVKAYRCYLTASANGIKAFFFGDEVTGINGVDAADTEIEAIYTINGTRVNNLQKGLNIVKMSNGKTQKVYVK